MSNQSQLLTWWMNNYPAELTDDFQALSMYASLVSGVAIIQAVEAVASVKSWPINLKGWANSSQARSQKTKAATDMMLHIYWSTNKVQQQSSSHSRRCKCVILCDLWTKVCYVGLPQSSEISAYTTGRVGASITRRAVDEAIHTGSETWIQQSNHVL